MTFPPAVKFVLCLLFGQLVLAHPGVAATPIGPEQRCLVELRFTPALKELSAKSAALNTVLFALPYETLRDYSLTPAANLPDYRIGLSSQQKILFLLMQTCTAAQKTMVEVEKRYRLLPKSFPFAVTFAKPGPGNLRGAQFFAEKPKFWRRDCIVGFLDRSNSPDSSGRFWDFGFRYVKQHVNRYALWSLRGGGSRDAPNFIQYTHDCDRRLEMTRSLIYAFGQIDGDAAHLHVLEKRFEPGPKTIDSHGSSWLDPIPKHLR